jgi:hypothetical protein
VRGSLQAAVFGERRLEVAEHEAALRPVAGRAANAHAGRDIIVAPPRIGGR